MYSSWQLVQQIVYVNSGSTSPVLDVKRFKYKSWVVQAAKRTLAFADETPVGEGTADEGNDVVPNVVADAHKQVSRMTESQLLQLKADIDQRLNILSEMTTAAAGTKKEEEAGQARSGSGRVVKRPKFFDQHQLGGSNVGPGGAEDAAPAACSKESHA